MKATPSHELESVVSLLKLIKTALQKMERQIIHVLIVNILVSFRLYPQLHISEIRYEGLF